MISIGRRVLYGAAGNACGICGVSRKTDDAVLNPDTNAIMSPGSGCCCGKEGNVVGGTSLPTRYVTVTYCAYSQRQNCAHSSGVCGPMIGFVWLWNFGGGLSVGGGLGFAKL